MADPFTTMYRLTARGGAGLACDERGVTLGPITLVDPSSSNGKSVYRARPAEEIARALARAYGPFSADELARRLSGLDVAARALEAGDLAKAGIATVLLRLPPLTLETFAKLAAEPTLRKYSPDQPRDERGRWTSEEGNTDSDGTLLAGGREGSRASTSSGLVTAGPLQRRRTPRRMETMARTITRKRWELLIRMLFRMAPPKWRKPIHRI